MKAGHYLLVSLIFFATASDHVLAQSGDDSRIQRLEESIRALERRVASLEEQLRERPVASRVAPDKVNWRKLRNGMAESDVEQLLGSPSKVWVNEAFIKWYYSGGSVQFDPDSHTVTEWIEP